MNLNDYKFEVGDKVVTTYGVTGKIVDICDCDQCARRGFYEPMWVDDATGAEHWITFYQAEHGFEDYYQIGEHRFNHEFHKSFILRRITECEEELQQYKAQLNVIEGFEGDA